TAKASRISRFAVKSRCAREWGGWGRLSDEGPDSISRTGARAPGAEGKHPPWRRKIESSPRHSAGSSVEGGSRKHRHHSKPGHAPRSHPTVARAGQCGHEDLGRWRLVAERSVGPHGVEVTPPAFDYDLGPQQDAK